MFSSRTMGDAPNHANGRALLAVGRTLLVAASWAPTVAWSASTEPPTAAADEAYVVTSTPEGTPVADVGGVVITAEQLGARLSPEEGIRHGGRVRDVFFDLLDDRIRFELLAHAAAARHLDRDPEVIDAARQVMVRKLLGEVLKDGADGGSDAQEARLRAFFEQHRRDYQAPEKRRIATIMLAPRAQDQAQSLLERLRRHQGNRSEFTALAKKFSREASSRNHGGEVPFTTAEEMGKRYGQTVASAVFAHSGMGYGAGGLVPQPVLGRSGWQVLQVLERTQAAHLDFAAVKDAIALRLTGPERERRFRAYLNALRRAYPVTVHATALERFAERWHAHHAATPGSGSGAPAVGP